MAERIAVFAIFIGTSLKKSGIGPVCPASISWVSVALWLGVKHINSRADVSQQIIALLSPLFAQNNRRLMQNCNNRQ
jgi:hypothetical protein